MSLDGLRQLLIGPPFPSSREIHERLDKVRALAIFASDPISSNAYATEAMMTVLVALGSAGLALTLPLGLGVALLVLTVIFSYIQTILHYPDSGGAYTVAKDNLGRLPSLVAGAALMTDYVLTVSVSVSAGVRAVTSAFPELLAQRVLLALAAIALVTWINLRGVRESGTVFAVPTYAFVGGGLLVVGIGLVRWYGLFGAAPIPPAEAVVPAQIDLAGFAYVWLLLRAFAGGCTALTGIEAISNGVSSFKPPESANAIKTMLAMGLMAMSLFIGITFLATQLHLVPSHGETILSQLTRRVAGTGLVYYWVQLFTMLILFLAANTGFQAFPRLGSFMARDGFLPRWMQNRGDRLVHSSGILVLAVVSALLVVVFQANEIAMLPLYAIGVMLSFSLSQAGMFRRMGVARRLPIGQTQATAAGVIKADSGAGWKQAVNGLGALMTFVVFLILVTTKFAEGAWIIVAVIPLLILLFLRINRHYEWVATALSTRQLKPDQLTVVADVALVPIGDIHRGVLRALKYARLLSPNVRAVAISTSPEMRERIERRWRQFDEITTDMELVILDYDFRDVLTPLVAFIEHVNHVEFPYQLVTVVIPEFVAESFWEGMLHNRTANALRRELSKHKDIVVIDVPYHIVSAHDYHAGRNPPESADDGANSASIPGPQPSEE